MKLYSYRYKYRINIVHSIKDAAKHPHTVEMVLYCSKKSDEFKGYDFIEKVMEMYFEQYENEYLNEHERFKNIVPTIENIAYEFYIDLKKILDEEYQLNRLDISEVPYRIYTVTDFLLAGEIGEAACVGEEKLAKYIVAKRDEVVTLMEAAYTRESEKSDSDVVLKEKEKQKIFKEVVARKTVQDYEYSDNLKFIKENKKINKIRTILCLALSIPIALLLGIYLSSVGTLPKGSDIYLYLGKSQYLYEQLAEGHFAPIYMSSWYNGYQMFVTSAPIPYYFLTITQMLTGGDLLLGYIVFIAVIFVLSVWGWTNLGRKTGNVYVAFVIGILWIFIPENLRMMTQVGAVSHMVIIAILPHLIYNIHEYINAKKSMNLVMIAINMILMILTDTRLALLSALGLVIVFFWDSIKNKTGNRLAKVVFAMLLSLGLTMPWLYPALLEGSILNFEINKTGFYPDLIVVFIALMTLVIASGKNKYYYVISILFTAIAIWFEPYFAIMAYISIFIGIIQWRRCNKFFVYSILAIVGIHLMLNWNWISDGSENGFTAYERIEEEAEENTLSESVMSTNNRMLLLDLENENAALPAYYATAKGKSINLSYAAANHGAVVRTNLEQLEYALYTKNFPYLFDRSIEMGCDTVLISENGLILSIEDENYMLQSAKEQGYELIIEGKKSYTFHKEIPEQYGTINNYEGIAIGSNARVISILFPTFEEGISKNISDYSYQDLTRYDKIYISGIEFKTLGEFEQLILKLAEAGKKIYVDMDSIPTDATTNRRKFLDVTSQTVSFKDSFPTLAYKDNYYTSKGFYSEYDEWSTIYLHGLDNVLGYTTISQKELPFIGTKENDNIVMLGFNIVYHALERGDEVVTRILEDVFETSLGELPERQIYPVSVEYDKDAIVIESPKDNMNVNLAFQKVFVSEKNIENENNLVKVNEGTTVIRFDYTNVKKGIIFAAVELFLLMVYVISVTVKRKMKE